ncbi:hypothetical protein [Actinomadura sp. HBU206391]|uniref:hypothetical protein n=1 Tax=Actinomadura sp. HBU206391 TaxID=2731692 RepID=UPI00164FDDC5|nr:hypothetical protein [Actinomadura sp. HBU206391]MBC6456802.1 hypothetical protein [Actinomadura sp. HBU206391]
MARVLGVCLLARPEGVARHLLDDLLQGGAHVVSFLGGDRLGEARAARWEASHHKPRDVLRRRKGS